MAVPVQSTARCLSRVLWKGGRVSGVAASRVIGARGVDEGGEK